MQQVRRVESYRKLYIGLYWRMVFKDRKDSEVFLNPRALLCALLEWLQRSTLKVKTKDDIDHININTSHLSPLLCPGAMCLVLVKLYRGLRRADEIQVPEEKDGDRDSYRQREDECHHDRRLGLGLHRRVRRTPSPLPTSTGRNRMVR